MNVVSIKFGVILQHKTIRMKITIITSAFMMAVASIQAQSYITLTPDVVAVTSDDPSVTLPSTATIMNTGPVDQQMIWTRVTNTITDGWYTAICDTYNCYSPTLDQAETPFSLDAGEDGSVHVNFYPNDLSGSGYVEVKYYSETDSANYNAFGVYSADVTGVGFSSPNMDNSFRAYPNPANEVVNLIASYSSNIKTVSIINIVGKQVLSQRWEVSNGVCKIALNEIPDGIYFIQFMNADNEVITTKKLSVKH